MTSMLCIVNTECIVFHSQGKVFPKLRKRSPHGSCDSVSDKEDDEATDYVFRILFPGNQMEFSKCLQSSCAAKLINRHHRSHLLV